MEVKANGIKFKLFGYHIRIWSLGYEYGKNGKGKWGFFPWARF